jgi:uncharacterized membrane protein (DUF373 family)
VKSRTQKTFKQWLRYGISTRGFNRGIDAFETLISKVLAIGMVFVISIGIFDVGRVLIQDLLVDPRLFLDRTLLDLLGLFLTLLIAVEILQNITAYLQKHTVQLELVIVTSLTAVARKIILLDLDKIDGLELIGLGITIFTLSISYWVVKATKHEK